MDEYSKKIDSWSLGCIFGELLNKGVPLFAGKNEIS
jgi:serine/threonine protein kinase